MDMKISGYGEIAAGEYETIRISGSGRLRGFVRCENLHISGSASGEELVCKNELQISGSSRFSKAITAKSVSISGSFSCAGGLHAAEKISCSGDVKCESNVKCATLSVSGGLSASGDVEAETILVRGNLNCDGLINAEELTIESNEEMQIGSIGGSRIAIYRRVNAKAPLRLPLLSSFLKRFDGMVRVKGAIEGDKIALENVSAPRVSGRVVAVGEGCEIELVQYSEQIEISPNAKVGRTEKIG